MLGKRSTTILFLGIFLFSGCSRYYVDVSRQKINANYLASTAVGSPDPRQTNPPLGEMLVINWQVPMKMVAQKPHIKLYVIYWDNEEKVYTWPIQRWKGYRTFSVLNKEFIRSGGILTYRAEIVDADGEIYREWKHQLWVNLIKIDAHDEP